MAKQQPKRTKGSLAARAVAALRGPAKKRPMPSAPDRMTAMLARVVGEAAAKASAPKPVTKAAARPLRPA